VKRIGLALVSLLAAAVLVGSPALAAKKKAHHPAVPCSKIKDAIAAGKSAEDVQKEMNVSAERVKSCTEAPSKSGSKKAPAKKAS
jgi:hypothetical protein